MALRKSEFAVRSGLGVAIALALGGCAVNPVTGERELALISEEQEVAMGQQAAEQVEASMGFVADEALQSYVSRVGNELARDSERPDLPWEFHVVDDPVPNAFALPGGYIFITRGMANLMSSEAELAAVLGHEIGHVTARHSVNQLSRAQLAQLGLGLGTVLSPEIAQYGDLANTGLSLLFLKYGRDDERQADELGFRYMLDDGYDVREMDDIFAALQASGDLAGRSATPSWLASHPSEPERIEAVRERVAALDSPPQDLEVNAEEYLAQIDGLTYGADPRNGYFEEGMFYHPELAFQFRVPEDWQKQNLTSAVVAVSPEQNAALQLTLAPGGATEAARQFFSQEGIAEAGSDRTRINGRDAVVSRFEAQSSGGVVRGLVAHIEHGEATYRLVGYAPAGAFGQYGGLFEEVIESFGPVTESSVLDVEPMRIDIVTLERDMTLEEFERNYPSAIPIEELAVLNQVESPTAALPRGTPVKRVVG